MRKSVLACLSTILAVLILSLVFKGIGGRENITRYHQHLRQPSETNLGPCSTCGGAGILCTHLPILNIETGGQKIPGKPIADSSGSLLRYETGEHGETEIFASLSTVETENSWHHPEDTPTLESRVSIRVRGNSSRWFDKSSYFIQLVKNDDPEQENKLPLLGMTSGNEWALYGPFLDKTLMRNYMWLNLSAEVMGYAPNVRFCEVMLNGEYQGVYILMETIRMQEGRVDLTQYQPGDPVCSYMVRIEPKTNLEKTVENFTFYTLRLEKDTHLEVLYPGLKNQTQQVKEYVQTDFSEIERKLYSLDMTSGSDSYQDLIDVDSFVDYYILMEFLGINDCFSASTYFYRDVRGKLHAGPVWDYNNALDNFFKVMPEDEFLLVQRGWFGQLMYNEDFVERVIRRYHELREGVLSEDHLLEYTTQVEDWLGSAIDRNFEVWGYSFDANQLTRRTRRMPSTGSNLTLEDLNPSSYEEAIEQMTGYMTRRGRWMDRQIETLRQYCHPSKTAAQTLG